MQAQADAHQNCADSLETEKDALRQQSADLRDKLIKALAELESLKLAAEGMVPRCVCVCVCVLCMYGC